jgi:gliding motility-associated-like protein
MKPLLLLLIAFIIAPFISYSSHIQGGNIQLECLGGNQYQITLTLYEDCGTAFTGSGNLTVYSTNTCGQTNQTTSLTNTIYQQEVSQLCPQDIPNSECNGGSLPGVYMHQWTGTVTLPANCDDWCFYYSSCCWNSSTNATGQPGYYYQTCISTSSAPCNSTPTIQAEPIPYVCAGQNVNYSLAGTQPDPGHTIQYSLIAPYTSATGQITYQGGYSAGAPIPGVTIDPNTGQINFNTNTAGNYIVGVEVTELDAAGNVISTTWHYYQFVVINCTNTVPDPPVGGLSNLQGAITSTGANSFEICENNNFCFDVVFSDPDAGDVLTVVENVQSVMPGATVTTTGTNPVTTTVCYTPPIGSAGNFILSFQAEDDACPTIGQTAYNVFIDVVNICCLPPIMNFTDETCLGDNDGTASADPNGTAPFDFSWEDAGGNVISTTNNSNGPDNVTGLAPGTYTVFVTDATGCTEQNTVTIGAGPNCCTMTNTVNSADASCNGVCDGTITLTAANFVAPVNYSIDNGATTQTNGNFAGLCAGNYDVLITDGAGCIFNQAVTINEPVAVAFTYTTNPSSCGQADGDFTITPSGGSGAGYEISFDNGVSYGTNPTLTGVAAGTYDVCVRDNMGCVFCDVAVVNDDPAQTIDNVATVDLLCNGDGNGSITITASGGTGVLTYGINNNPPQASNVFNGLNGGNYTIQTFDGNGCQVNSTAIINEPTALSFNQTSVNLDCFQQCIGEIHFTNQAGGTLPYQYSVDNGASFQASPDFTGLCAGTYDLVLQDANLCQETAQVIITEPAQLTNTVATVDAICNGYCDGEITVTGAGGTAPYIYIWANGIAPLSSPTATALCAGTYDVTLEDDNGCQVVNNGIIINEPPAMTIQNIASTDALCSNTCDGTVTVTEPTAVSFQITGINTGVILTQANGNFNGLCPDTYDVEVSNVDGCMATGQIVVGVPNPVSLVVSPDVTICQNDNTTMTATGSGGDGNFSYTWDNIPGANTNNVTPMTTTSYSVYATDGNGCQTNAMVITVNVLPALQVTALTSQDICPGQVANISAIGQGGDGNYTYTWDDGTTTFVGQFQSVSPTVTTTYTVTLSDGCTSTPVTDQITITVNPVPQVSFTGINLDGCTPVMPTFSNDTDPALSAQCLWDFGDGNFSNDCNPSHLYEDPGCYDVTLTVTSADGCVGSASQAQMVCVYDIPVANFELGPQPTTILEPQITFNNFSIGGDYHLWTFGDGDSSNQVNPVHDYTWVEPNSYDVTLIESNVHGCADTAYATVIIDDIFLIYTPNAFTPNGDGLNDVFLPVLSGTSTENYTLYIFDRWGQIIFESNAPGEGWTGTVNGQLPEKTDVYSWKIVLKTFENHKKEFVGHVTLLR